MQYNRENMNELPTYKSFEPGANNAVISSVTGKKAKTGKSMFEINLSGSNGESGTMRLVFGTDYTDSNLTRILASIEDNNQPIPAIDFGYTKETMQFLNGKRVFVMAKERTGTYTDKNGVEKQSTGTEIKYFLSKEEFMKNNNSHQQAPKEANPFGTSPIEISDDMLPF